MNIATIILGILSALLLGVTLFLLLRRHPLQQRFEGLLAERSGLNASLEHARQMLADEQERGRKALAGEKDAARDILNSEREAARQLLANEKEAARQLLASEKEAARIALAGEREATRIALEAEQQRVQKQLDEQRKWVADQTEHFETRVLAAAARLMEERSRAFSELNQKEVNTVVAPFKEQLAEFRQRVDHIYAQDAQERGSLRTQIEQLTTMNTAMSLQAERLVNALTITSKSAGDWGETILEKILEDSGLRRGHEYELQVTVHDVNGERQRPDAIIRLPESRQLVIDSKVSNKAWADYCAAANDEERGTRLKDHLASLRGHMKELSRRAYSDNAALKTVDFVLMFVPVEAALLTAFVKDPTLYTDAYRSRIVMVTPSTLMAVVKLVEGIWTFQKRKESADEIAEAGRKLYEKIATFAQSFLSVGKAIQQSNDAFEQARGQLSTGKGNALRLAEQLKDMGVTPTRQIPAALLEPTADEEQGAPGAT